MSEYPATETLRRPRLPEGVKVELFAAAQEFNSRAMEKLSGIIISDIYQAAERRVSAREKN
jgi:hypothetical protein